MKHRRTAMILLLALSVWLVALPAAADKGSTALVGRDFVLEAGERLAGDIAILSGDATIERGAVVTGNVAILGGSLQIKGMVQGDVVVVGGSLALGPEAWIQGDIVALGTLERDPGARVGGNIVTSAERGALNSSKQQAQEKALSTEHPAEAAESGLRNVLRWAAGALGILLLCVLTFAILPEATLHIAQAMERSALLSGAVGLVTLLAIILLVPLLIILLVGIPLAIILVIGLGLALICGWTAGARLLGRQLLHLLKRPSSSALLDLALGAVALALLARIPCLGALLVLAVACWGLGGVVLTRFGTSPGLVWAPFEPLATRSEHASHPAAEGPSSGTGASPSDTRELWPWELDDEPDR